ncbi:M48 family metallopeptidase [Undibacterium pigrum]|uniref:Peptidase M48-like protein n=1 Tax=Undibacterium pigrum TaxID=401470 RepID=A0A318JC92_9BURK|nr:M48 family metallopeptidase [Undibacterium pigrum]PXX46511.1 peptidase M48-like protein [Undibacterium pigrum]
MRATKKILIASLIIALSGSAFAQLGDLFNKLPGNVKTLAEGAKNLVDKTKEIDEPKEIALGNEFAASLLGAKPLLNDPALQRYVNTLGRWLASQTERPDLPWTFAVLDDVGFNAFATPGGNIFVTRGLLARMRSESELAGVLAHEIAHVLRKHHLNAIRNAGGVGVFADLAASQLKWDANLKTFAANVFKDLYAKGLDKADEYDADRVGVVIAARAGFDPYGLPAVIQTLQSQSAQDNNFTLQFETHPSPADRLDSLDKAMRNRFESTNGSQGRPFNERVKEFSR